MNWIDAIDLYTGFLLGVWFCVKHHKPVLPIKVTKLPPDHDTTTYTGWTDMITPQVKKLELSAKLDLNFTFNPVGAKAMADTLKNLGGALDKFATEYGGPRRKC